MIIFIFKLSCNLLWWIIMNPIFLGLFVVFLFLLFVWLLHKLLNKTHEIDCFFKGNTYKELSVYNSLGLFLLNCFRLLAFAIFFYLLGIESYDFQAILITLFTNDFCWLALTFLMASIYYLYLNILKGKSAFWACALIKRFGLYWFTFLIIRTIMIFIFSFFLDPASLILSALKYSLINAILPTFVFENLASIFPISSIFTYCFPIMRLDSTVGEILESGDVIIDQHNNDWIQSIWNSNIFNIRLNVAQSQIFAAFCSIPSIFDEKRSFLPNITLESYPSYQPLNNRNLRYMKGLNLAYMFQHEGDVVTVCTLLERIRLPNAGDYSKLLNKNPAELDSYARNAILHRGFDLNKIVVIANQDLDKFITLSIYDLSNVKTLYTNSKFWAKNNDFIYVYNQNTNTYVPFCPAQLLDRHYGINFPNLAVGEGEYLPIKFKIGGELYDLPKFKCTRAMYEFQNLRFNRIVDVRGLVMLGNPEYTVPGIF